MNIDTINYPNGTKLVVTPRTTTFIDQNGKPILLDRAALAFAKDLAQAGASNGEAYEQAALDRVARAAINKRIDVC